MHVVLCFVEWRIPLENNPPNALLWISVFVVVVIFYVTIIYLNPDKIILLNYKMWIILLMLSNKLRIMKIILTIDCNKNLEYVLLYILLLGQK